MRCFTRLPRTSYAVGPEAACKAFQGRLLGGTAVFESIRAKKHEAALEFHLYKIFELGRIRGEWEDRGRPAEVLKMNFEMASHATRALQAVRKLEEIGNVLTPEEAADSRAKFTHVVNLPAIRSDEIQSTDRSKIEALYQDYRRYNFPAEQTGTPGSDSHRQANLATNNAGASRYDFLLDQARQDVAAVDMNELRMAYAETPGHDPYASGGSAIKEAQSALQAGNHEEAIQCLAPVLKADFLNIKAHLLYADAIERWGEVLERESTAEWQRRFAAGLLRSILSSGSGESYENAYQVISMAEEYAVLDSLGYSTVVPPEFVVSDGHKYDVFQVEGADPSTTRIYFQIDAIHGKTGQLADAEVGPESPEYGGVLLSMARRASERGDSETALVLLDRFIQHVRDWTGKALSPDEAESYIAKAEVLKARETGS